MAEKSAKLNKNIVNWPEKLGGCIGVLWELKQELYFVGQNFEIFIIEFSAREKLKQNND